VLTGNPSGLQSGHDLFRSYSYNIGRDSDTHNRDLLLWPPFMIAQRGVLCKDIPPLINILESPDTNEVKAFELSAIVRLLSHSDNSREFVPRHRLV